MQIRPSLDRRTVRTVFTLAWPTMLEQLTQTLVQYIDTAMVGALGTYATAAVGATSTVNWLIGSTISALGVGFLAQISQSLGAGDKSEARRISAQAFSVTVIAGICLTALTMWIAPYVPVWMQVDTAIQSLAGQYFRILYMPMLFRTASIVLGTVLRAAGDTRTPMRIGLFVNLINIAANFLLIFPSRPLVVLGTELTLPGAGLGVEGAAWASAASFIFGGAAMTAALWRHPDVSPKGCRFKMDKGILKRCFRIALPNLLQRFATSFGYVVFAAMINALGDVSTAAHTIANTVESAFYIPGWGMQTAAAALSGRTWGARDAGGYRKLSRSILFLEVTLMVLSGLALFVLAPPLVRLFSRDEQVVRLGITVLRMVALSEPFYGIPIVVEGMMQGVGKTVAPFVYNVVGMWCVRILGTWICTRFLGGGLVSAWGCMIAHNLVLCVLFTFHYVSGKADPWRTPRREGERAEKQEQRACSD